jgi:hypothetical protein
LNRAGGHHPFAKKVFRVVFSVFVSIFAGKLVVLPFAIFLTSRYGSNLPENIGWVLVAIAVLLAISVGVLCYRRLYMYLSKEYSGKLL